MQLFRSFTAQYALSSLLSMAAPTSDSIADDSSSLTNERAPLWHKHYSKFGRDTGNTPLSREVKSALLAIGLSANSSRSLYSRPTAKLTRPKPGFSVLNPFYNHNLLPSRARRTNKKHRSHHASSCSWGIWYCRVASNLFPQPFTQLISRKHAAVVTADSRSVTELRTSAKSLRGQKKLFHHCMSPSCCTLRPVPV